MHEAYSDDFASVAVGDRDRLIPTSLRKLAGAVVFLGVVGAMGLWSYRLGTRDAAEVPVIRAMEGPTRIQPEDPGGAQAAHQGLEVNEVLSGTPAPMPRITEAPAPAPAPSVLAEEDAPQGALIVAAARAFAEPTEEEADLRMPPPEDGIETVEVGEGPELLPLIAETLSAEEAEIAETEAAAAAGARPRSRPGNLVRVSARTPAPARTAEAAPSPVAAPVAAPAAAAAPAAVQAREVASVSSGSRMVQLGAYDSEAITRGAWSQLVARNGDLLGSKSLYVERATSNSRVFYRLRVAGFASTEETRVMCEQLRARGVDCIPVTLQ